MYGRYRPRRGRGGGYRQKYVRRGGPQNYEPQYYPEAEGYEEEYSEAQYAPKRRGDQSGVKYVPKGHAEQYYEPKGYTEQYYEPTPEPETQDYGPPSYQNEEYEDPRYTQKGYSGSKKRGGKDRSGKQHGAGNYTTQNYSQNQHPQQRPTPNKKGKVTVLMVAEKPSIATAVAHILGNNVKSRKGASKVAMVHEYAGDFFGTPALFRVTSVAGHIYSRDFPSEYNNWSSVDPVDLFDADTVTIDKPRENFNITKHLSIEARGADYLVLWLDCDREGENICFEVIKVIGHLLPSDAYERNIYRAHFSSLAEKDIIDAYNNLNDGPNLNQSLSVDARQIIDLKVGAAFTRIQTLTLKKKHPELNLKVVSYGPCQTPTLGFCIDQYIKRLTFVPVDYWFLSGTIKRNEQTLKLTWDRNRVYSYVEFSL